MIPAVIVVIALLAVAAVLYARRAPRRRGLHRFDVPRPVVADGPVSMHLERGPAPIVEQALDEITRRELADGARRLHAQIGGLLTTSPTYRPAHVVTFPPGVTAAEATAGVEAFTRTLAAAGRAAHPALGASTEVVNGERRMISVATGGRHRRDEPIVDNPLTMTGFIRKLDADAIAAGARMQAAVDVETGRIPRVRG